jgi:hypothetical protein
VEIVGIAQERLLCHTPTAFAEGVSQALKCRGVKATLINALIKIKAETESAVKKDF